MISWIISKTISLEDSLRMELLIQRAWTFLRLLVHVAELIFRRMTPVSIQIITVSQHLLLLPHIQGLVLSSYSQGQLLAVPQLGP